MDELIRYIRSKALELNLDLNNDDMRDVCRLAKKRREEYIQEKKESVDLEKHLEYILKLLLLDATNKEWSRKMRACINDL